MQSKARSKHLEDMEGDSVAPAAEKMLGGADGLEDAEVSNGGDAPDLPIKCG